MSDEEPQSFGNIDWSAMLDNFRKSASIKMGATMFGEAQVAYYDVLKKSMSEEDAYNMLAHTTECVFRAVATATGPLAEALLKVSVVWEEMARRTGGSSEKEVPGS